MKLLVFICLLASSLAQEKTNSRQNKAWKFAEESNKETVTPTTEESVVREERTSDLLQPSNDERRRSPKILDAGSSVSSNTSQENVEGRFFLKDKLCLLGLADCRQKKAYQGGGGGVNLGGIQYVQPVKVVPHGQPIAAVPITNPHHSSTYQVPSYHAPKPSYGAPKPSYGAPKPTYNAPKPSYGAPKPTYDAPKPSYGAPKPTYDAPKPSYGAPKPTYKAPKPSYNAPSSTYSAPSSTYQDSSLDSYGVDRYQGQLTGNIYSHPYQTNFGSTSIKRDDGVSHHGSSHHGGSHGHHHGGSSHGHQSHHGSNPGGNHGTSHGTSHGTNQHHGSTFHSSVSSSSATNGHHQGGHRQGRLEDDCYCVPINQCPSYEVVGGSSSSSQFSSGFAKQFTNTPRKDYSHLINPRNKKTNIEAEEDDEVLEEAGQVELENSEEEISKDRTVREGKSLETERKSLTVQKETINKQNKSETTKEANRRRRDVEEPQDFVQDEYHIEEDATILPRLTNTFVDGEVTTVSEEETTREALTRDDEIIILEANDEASPKNNQSLPEKEAKFNLEEIQDTVSNKLSNVSGTVSSVGNKVSSGVNDIIRNIGSALGLGENFQPTVGVSFGLPFQPNNLYAGQVENPLGTGSAVNPYYTGPNGVPVGALDVSPLVSFQTTTNDDGEIVSKPLINLHLVPNGCGIFGCDSAEDYTQKSSAYNQYLASNYYGATNGAFPPVAKRKYGPEPNPNKVETEFRPSLPQQTIQHEHHHYHHGVNHINMEENYASLAGYSARDSSGSANKENKKSGFRFPEGRSLDRKKRDVDQLSTTKNPFLRKAKKIIKNNHQQLTTKTKLTEGRQRIPFGPNGIKPPTCGFPNSGYVCCRVASNQVGVTQFIGGSPSSNFNQLSTQKNNRAVSSSSSGRFTTFNNNLNSGSFTPGQCGKRNAQGINGRITGTLFERKSGETEFGEYPWQVAILKKDEFDNVYLCAGSLIDGTHVITAAHCIRGYNPNELVLRLGEWDVNNDSEFYTHVELDAKNIFIHENFYPGNLYNDIAVIRLTEYIDFSRNRHISPVCLPDSFHNFAGQRCYVTGWGKDAFLDGNYQHILKEVNVPVLDNARCENLLRRTKLGSDFVLDKGFLCAGGEQGKDACKGDGGGPLVCEVNGLWQLAGIVSWGIGCGEYNVPGVYIKVSEYEDWIQKQLLRAF